MLSIYDSLKLELMIVKWTEIAGKTVVQIIGDGLREVRADVGVVIGISALDS